LVRYRRTKLGSGWSTSAPRSTCFVHLPQQAPRSIRGRVISGLDRFFFGGIRLNSISLIQVQLCAKETLADGTHLEAGSWVSSTTVFLLLLTYYPKSILLLQVQFYGTRDPIVDGPRLYPMNQRLMQKAARSIRGWVLW